MNQPGSLRGAPYACPGSSTSGVGGRGPALQGAPGSTSGTLRTPTKQDSRRAPLDRGHKPMLAARGVLVKICIPVYARVSGSRNSGMIWQS